MSCIYYQNDTLHKLSENEQEEHLKTCPLCQEGKKFEDQVLQEANQLKPIKPDADLWGKIESSLMKETEGKKNKIFPIIKPTVWLSAAAIFAVVLSVSAFYFFSVGPDKILSDGALLRVEFTEQNYIEAIKELEQETTPKMAQLDIDLMLLYRDKLETINTQINRCREAINNNPGNAHIRRYMLAALQDKKETLNEILEI